MNTKHDTIKLFALDLNFSRFSKPRPWILASAPQDWAFIDPKAYFDYHCAIGNNAIFLKVRKPHQRVMTTVIGRVDKGECDVNSWREWREKGCDLFGYAWCTPPRIKPHPSYARDIRIVRRAFKQIPCNGSGCQVHGSTVQGLEKHGDLPS